MSCRTTAKYEQLTGVKAEGGIKTTRNVKIEKEVKIKTGIKVGKNIKTKIGIKIEKGIKADKGVKIEKDANPTKQRPFVTPPVPSGLCSHPQQSANSWSK